MLPNSNNIITSKEIKIPIVIKLYVFSKKVGNIKTIDDIIANIEPVINNASSTISLYSIDLKYGYTPELIKNRKSNHII